MTTKLLRDIGKLYYEADDYNVCITVGGEDEDIETETFNAHSVILRVRSAYFQNVLSRNNHEVKKDGEIFLLKKPNIHPDVFRLLLKYIYTGICGLKESDMQDMYVPLLLAAAELSLLDLVEYIQLHIISNEQSWLHENIIHIFHIASNSTTFSLLSKHCCELICENPSLLFSTPSFTRLEKCSLLMIIKRDDLDLIEIDVWKYLLQWAINQYPLLNSYADVSSWTKKDFIELEDRLKDFLPFIRFFQIPGNQLYEFIWPFKKILPKKLKSQLTKFHMTTKSELPSSDSSFNLSPRVSRHKIDSLYISGKHAGMLNAWINSGKSGIKKVEFNLLLRGSRDGMDVKTFHKLCDNKGPTIVLIKILGNSSNSNSSNSNNSDSNSSDSSGNRIITSKRHTIGSRTTSSNSGNESIDEINNSNSNNGNVENIIKVRRFSNNTINTTNTTNIKSSSDISVIGGYNPLSWSSSDTYKQTNDSFIFSFTNESSEYILSRVQNSQYAIRDMSCKFNNIGFGHDLWWFSGSCTQQYYEKRIMPTTHSNTFVIEDYEVFQVMDSNEESEDNSRGEILEESQSVGGSDVKGDVKSANNDLNDDKLHNKKNIRVYDSTSERDGSVLNVGDDKSFKSDDSLSSEVVIL